MHQQVESAGHGQASQACVAGTDCHMLINKPVQAERPLCSLPFPDLHVTMQTKAHHACQVRRLHMAPLSGTEAGQAQQDDRPV